MGIRQSDYIVFYRSEKGGLLHVCRVVGVKRTMDVRLRSKGWTIVGILSKNQFDKLGEMSANEFVRSTKMSVDLQNIILEDYSDYEKFDVVNEKDIQRINIRWKIFKRVVQNF